MNGTGFGEFAHFWFPPWAGGDDDNDNDYHVYKFFCPSSLYAFTQSSQSCEGGTLIILMLDGETEAQRW